MPSRKPPAQNSRWLVLAVSTLSGLLLWLAFKPVGWWPLAFLAPAGWLAMVRWQTLPGWRPYLMILLGAAVHWLLLLEGIRRAHPALYLGWFALAFYVAAYMPVFVGLTRMAVHRMRVSIVIAGPAIWVALELVRSHLLTGFSTGLIAHALVNQTTLIQIAELGGAYAVSFLVIFAAACLVRIWPRHGAPRTWRDGWPAVALSIGLIAVVVYGKVRLAANPIDHAPADSVRVVMIQGGRDTVFDFDAEVTYETYEDYWALTREALQLHEPVDLVIWPESAFTGLLPEFQREGDALPDLGFEISKKEFSQRLDERIELFQQKTRYAASVVNDPQRNSTTSRPTCMLVGSESLVYSAEGVRRYNSALLLDAEGRVANRYYKTHPVMFGEYIPFGKTFPWIYKVTPMADGLASGREAVAFDIQGVRFSPNICFESTVPHLIRRQVAELRQQGEMPDVLVNITNDGWFWGSAILDHHFASNVFRAVENGRPLLIAANTGISGWVDHRGRVRRFVPRREKQFLLATVSSSQLLTQYQLVGDWLARVCFVFLVVTCGFGMRERWLDKRRNKSTE